MTLSKLRLLLKAWRFVRRGLYFFDLFVCPYVLVTCGIICTVLQPWYISVIIWTLLGRIQVSKSPCPLKVLSHWMLGVEIKLLKQIGVK